MVKFLQLIKIAYFLPPGSFDKCENVIYSLQKNLVFEVNKWLCYHKSCQQDEGVKEGDEPQFQGEKDQVKLHDNISNVTSTPFLNKAGQFNLIYSIQCRLQSWCLLSWKRACFLHFIKACFGVSSYPITNEAGTIGVSRICRKNLLC